MAAKKADIATVGGVTLAPSRFGFLRYSDDPREVIRFHESSDVSEELMRACE